MNCNVQILTGENANGDYDGTLTPLGKVIFHVAAESGKVYEIITDMSNKGIKVRPLQRASLADLK